MVGWVAHKILVSAPVPLDLILTGFDWVGAGPWGVWVLGRGLTIMNAKSQSFIRKQFQEIEKRGLDIIGLYRLCGSETKKKMLREAFEADPEAVDLSSENVPDINVITSKSSIRDYNGCVVIFFSRFIERVPAGTA